MNKKKLSVVMAGAMLASSVAPVLADTTTSETSASELGLLIKKVRETLESKKFANETEADQKANGTEAGLSVYYIKINGTTHKDTAIDTQSELQALLGNLAVGSKVEIWSKGYEEKDGKYYAYKDVVPTYTTVSDTTNGLASIQDKVNAIPQTQKTALIDSANTKLENDVYTITFTAQVGLNPVELKVGSEQLDFTHFKNVSTGKIDEIANATATNFGGFATVDAVPTSIADEKVETITITSGGNNFKVEDLYDGLMLTEKGHDFLNELKYYDKIDGNASTKEATVGTVSKNKVTGEYSFTVTFLATGALSAQVYTITGTNEATTKTLQSWLDGRVAKVDILAGDNRYETAVNIAKEQVFGETNLGGAAKESNIVLVNGDSLVDGLSAAPLAAALKINNTAASTAAPILLTEANELPKATKAYLKELLANKTVSNLNTTVHLVGGTSVLTKSLERELKNLGFKVERHGGDNREETSLAVAEAIEDKKGSLKNAFVVGAEGEADAMSIAAKASELERPIIVAKKGGITEDAVDTLKDVNVTVIGGENAISKADFNAIKDEANTVLRIAGSNRQATNALVIEKYYGGSFVGSTKNVVVAKDGQNNKSELIDALSAANLASQKDAPVVLATNKLSTAQINALELNATNAATLYQVGNGVARDVVKTIAQILGLAN